MTRKVTPHIKQPWSPAQIEILRQKYADADLDELAVELAHARAAIVKQANMLGLKRSAAAMRATKKAAAKPNAGSFKPIHGRSWNGKKRTDPTYNSWLSMHQRCEYPAHKSYARYGGRGISVCARWSDFKLFLEDMGDRPKGMTLDRWPNTNGNYEPGNCRWATYKQQQRNRRSNRLIDFNGETKPLVEWAELYGIRRDTLAYRLKTGMPMGQALSRPVEPRKARG